MIRRLFGTAPDTVPGGSEYDDLAGGAIPDSTEHWPATGGSADKNLSTLNRNDEVRGRRSASPPISFRSEPVATIPVPAYLSIIAKVLAHALAGSDVVSGSGAAARTHKLSPLGFGADVLPKASHLQLVRDNLNHKLSGAFPQRIALNFPMDGFGTAEIEWHALYLRHDPAAAPTPTFVGLSKVPLMLRDARVFFDQPDEQQTVTLANATGGTYTLSFGGQTTAAIAYNATAAAVQAALEALSSIGVGNVVVTGAAGGPYTVRFVGALGSRDVAQMTANGASLTGTSPTVTVATTTPGGQAIPDLQGYEFTWVNNLVAKHGAMRNVAVDGEQKLWFPYQRKLGAAQDCTFRLIFGDTDSALEVKHEFAKVQRLVMECIGNPLGTTPAASELLRINQYASVLTGGGPEGLSARDDLTSNYEGGAFYSDADGKDVDIEVVNTVATSYLA